MGLIERLRLAWRTFRNPAPKEDPFLVALREQRELFETLIERQAEQTERIVSAQSEQVQALASATKSQADVLHSYLSIFNVATPPVARFVREEDEVRMEMARRGFPDGDPASNLAWVLAETATPE